jgi:EAL domain-containing protein (putative c-di-GMP-specific phosphodiesterase class I)
MARGLKFKVIAEGVETPAQRARLLECGCDQFQGFLFSRPVSAQALGELVDSGQLLGPVQGAQLTLVNQARA